MWPIGKKLLMLNWWIGSRVMRGSLCQPAGPASEIQPSRFPLERGGVPSRLSLSSNGLLAGVHNAVAALDQGPGRATDAVLRCVVRPAGPVIRPTAHDAGPRAVRVVGPHGVP